MWFSDICLYSISLRINHWFDSWYITILKQTFGAKTIQAMKFSIIWLSFHYINSQKSENKRKSDFHLNTMIFKCIQNPSSNMKKVNKIADSRCFIKRGIIIIARFQNLLCTHCKLIRNWNSYMLISGIFQFLFHSCPRTCPTICISSEFQYFCCSMIIMLSPN